MPLNNREKIATANKPIPITLNNLESAVEHGALFQGQCTLRPGQKIAFERPVRFRDVKFYSGMRIGAYTFMRSAYVSGNPTIGRYCSIGANFSIGEPNHPTDWLGTSSFQYEKSKFAFYDGMKNFIPKKRTLSTDPQGTIVGNDVWIGSNVMILEGVKVGDGAIIGAGAVVVSDVAPYTVVGGVPARLIRQRFPDDKITEQLMKLKWWDFLAPQLSGVPFDDPLASIKEIRRRVSAGQISREARRFGVIRQSGEGLQYVSSVLENKESI